MSNVIVTMSEELRDFYLDSLRILLHSFPGAKEYLELQEALRNAQPVTDPEYKAMTDTLLAKLRNPQDQVWEPVKVNAVVGFFSDSDINIVAHELMQEIQDTLTVEILDNIRLCRLVSQEREP